MTRAEKKAANKAAHINKGAANTGSGVPASGAGWGGPPNGEGNHGAGPGRPEGVKDGEGKRARARAALEEAAPLAVQTVIDIASRLEDPRALAAALGILNRVGMHEKSGVEVTGADAGPVKIKVEICDERDDAEAERQAAS